MDEQKRVLTSTILEPLCRFLNEVSYRRGLLKGVALGPQFVAWPLKLKMKLEDRIISFIAQSKGVVVLRSKFNALGASDSQVSRVLNKLIACEMIQRVSRGAFVKTKLNQFTGTFTLAAPLEVVAMELFAKLNIKIAPPPAVLDYNAGSTTQVPAGGIVVMKGRRVSRKISVAGRTVQYI